MSDSVTPLRLGVDALFERLAEVSAQLSAARTTEGVLDVAGRVLEQIGLNLSVMSLDDEMIVIQYLSPTTSRMAASFFGKSFLGSRMKVPPESLVRRAAGERKSHFYADAAAIARGLWAASGSAQPATPAAALPGVASPLVVAGKPWGAAVATGTWLTPEHVAPLHWLAAQLGPAISMAESMARLEQRNAELEAIFRLSTQPLLANLNDMATALIEVVAQATQSDVATLHSWDAESKQFVLQGRPFGVPGEPPESIRRFAPQTTLGFDSSAVAISASRVPVFSRELERLAIREVAVVPLRNDSAPAGALTLGRRTPTPFSADTLRTAEILGAQVSGQLNRASLSHQTTRRLRQLELLFSLTRAGSEARELNPLVSELLGRMLDAFPADIATIHLVEEDHLLMSGARVRSGSEFAPFVPQRHRVPIDDQTAVGRAATAMAVQRFRASDLPPQTRAMNEAMGIAHTMAAPLVTKGLLLGTFALGRKADEAFTDDDVRLLESVAAHVADLVERVQLLADLRKNYEALRTAQTELVKHERLAALGELSAIMAHEVRNPLGVIFNALTALKRTAPHDADTFSMLLIIEEEAGRLNRIVGDLLDFARPYTAERKPVPVETMVARAVDAATRSVESQNVKIVTEFPHEIPALSLDARLMGQAIINLVVNAIQAVPKGGQVTVRVFVEALRTSERLVIEVHDDGPGISPAAAARLFEPFFTTKAFGTGLGLAVVKRIVEAHGGDVSARAHAPRGTVFSIRIPAVQANVEPAALNSPS